MDDNSARSWRAQLQNVRRRVVEMQEQRDTARRLQRERNEDSLRKRLKEDTPDALTHKFNEIRRKSDRAARRFYPLSHIEAVLSELSNFGDLLRFYSDCMKSFGKVFQPAHKTTIKGLLGELGALQRGLDRQLGQWRAVNSALEALAFRPRRTSDNSALVTVAKAFSDRAHKIPLSLPGDFFAHENENFWVAETGDTILGYLKFWPEDKLVTFALASAEKINFKKLVRAILYKFHTDGPLSEPLKAVRVRLGYVREVKFFTDIGFVRAETKGPSNWIYQRAID